MSTTERTFAEHIEDAAGGEAIVAVVIGDVAGDDDSSDDERHAPGLARKGELLSWDEAKPLLSYRYDAGHSYPDCHAVMAWTNNRVISTYQYDGSTWVGWCHRNPVAYLPEMQG